MPHMKLGEGERCALICSGTWLLFSGLVESWRERESERKRKKGRESERGKRERERVHVREKEVVCDH